MHKKNINSFLVKFEEAIYNNSAAIFCGAGTSMSSGFANWSELLRPAAEELSLKIEKEDDLITLAQYFVNQEQNKRPLFSIIEKELKKQPLDNKTLTTLTKLPIHTYWTTNYDSEIEDYLIRRERKPLVLRKNMDFYRDQLGYTDKVYKFHGDKEDIENCVITRDDYQNYSTTHQLFVNSLLGDLTNKTFLFLGYSFQDPDFNNLLATLSTYTKDNMQSHYFIEAKASGKGSSYINKKKELASKDRLRAGIKTIWIEDYKTDLPEILACLYNKNKTRYIHVGGSNRKNPDGWTDELIYKFQTELGKKLIQKRYHVATAMIEGTAAFSKGVLEQINEDNLVVEDYFKLNKMPRIKNAEGNLEVLLNDSTKRQYQESILEESGIFIFIFGNQTYDGGASYIPAKGVMNEFNRAKKNKNYIIPIPQTEGASRVIFEEIKHNISDYGYLKKFATELETIDKNDTEKMVDMIIRIIDYIHVEKSIFL
ncbi:hypothetical protein RU86_GL000349 [Lactococcus piscium]|uniref:NAD(+) hydrolase ThsA Sir2/TIR-associating SLOG domain-containing protein n=1 Tax=Pseudolactococcus piscium TaxID=1364 RepID=A0A2A5RYV0_9LACT|nr:SIR2 family protein [Lactococcus piscium]PCS06393.1 hypothetical protein RU86_GL000349 [Lactococcus piscium]